MGERIVTLMGGPFDGKTYAVEGHSLDIPTRCCVFGPVFVYRYELDRAGSDDFFALVSSEPQRMGRPDGECPMHREGMTFGEAAESTRVPVSPDTTREAGET